MNDRRPLIAIALILVIAFIPSFFMDPPVRPDAVDNTPASTAATTGGGVESLTPPPALQAAPVVDSAISGGPIPGFPDDTVLVRSGLYEYGISTRGGQIVSARFLRYRTMHADDNRDTLQLLPVARPIMDARLVVAGDTVRFDATQLTPNASQLTVSDGPATLRMVGSVRGVGIELDYTFVPDDYRIHLEGRLTGIGSTGGTLLLGLGNGFRDTEANLAENHREGGVVTKRDGTELTRFSSLDPLVPEVLSGPFEWVAVKSKYFVAGLFSYDSTRVGSTGNIGGVLAIARDSLPEKPVRAEVRAGLLVSNAGTFNATLYLGPMEYDRLRAMGHDFDDVNPYGWPGFRTVIRPFAVAIRAIFVWMHETLGLHYGLAIVFFGVMIRVVLWPLNQKAMRSMTAMQAIQPELQELQKRYKEDPARLQQEMFKLYKEHKVNPFGGCWPMLLPYPFLVAVFFVLQNTIEIRGVGFLWMPDLSRPDPLFIIPVVMAVSMFGISKIGQLGMPPNPQAKMMMYVMPVMLGVLFLNFASGLNLYYAVQNLASIPQQWLIMKERQKLMAMKAKPQVEVKTKKG
ncbi:MAG: membrane protein insertase YidC [Gemmatimonadales bacterium]|nr:membrane protein insertase YidC [Gemmatimonadales bacterium]